MSQRLRCILFVSLFAPALAAACGDEGNRKLGARCSADGECAQGICGGGICMDPDGDDDRDGLVNAHEVRLGTNPRAADSDNDGYADGDELDDQQALLDLDGDGIPDVLESATADADDDCIPDQFDADDHVADAELAGLVAIVCKTAGVCGAARADLVVVCDSSAGKRVARCDYGAVAGFEPDELTCDGLDNDCDGATDEQGPDLDRDGLADCIDDDRDGDEVLDVTDVCPSIADPAQRDSDGDGDGDACDPPQPPVVTATDPRSPAIDPTPILAGLTDPDTTVHVHRAPTCSGDPLASALSDAAGAFAIEVDAAPDAETRFVLRAENTAGLLSACIPSAFSFVHDQTAPAPPTLTTVAPPSPSADDSPRVSGRAEALSRVELHAAPECGDTPLGAGQATADGTFAIVVTVPSDTRTTLYAVAVDLAGNRSTCAALATYEHSGERPPPPTPHPIPFTPQSPSPDQPNPLLRGCADDGATVDVYAQAGCLGPLKATLTAAAPDEGCPDGAAFFGLVAATPNTVTTFHGQVRGAPGRVSACVPLGTYEHDDVAPAAPVFVSVTPTSPSSSSRPILFGTAEPGLTVTLHADDAACAESSLVGHGTSADDGAFIVVATLPEDTATGVFARARDRAGNDSPCALLTTYVHDGTTPLAPSPHPIQPFTPASPSASEDTPILRGCAVEGVDVRVFTSADCLGTPVATLRAVVPENDCATGFAFVGDVAVATPSSSTTFHGQTINGTGERSACASLGTYVLDPIAPPPPTLSAFDPPSPSLVTTPVVRGRAEPGARVTLFHGASCDSGVEVGTATADPAGAWVIVGALEGLDTTTRFFADAHDPAGNRSTCAALGTWTHDGTAPAPPTMLAAQRQAVANPSSAPAPEVRLCAEANARVDVYTSEDCTGPGATATPLTGSTACAAIPGTAEQRFTLAVDRPVTYHARATDGAGNRSDCAALFEYVFDATAPAAPLVQRVVGASWILSDANNVARVDLRVFGRTEPGARVRFSVDGSIPSNETVADADGRFEGIVTGVDALTAGDRSLYAQARDAAGNVGPASLPVVVVGEASLAASADGEARAGLRTAVHFPDGTLFVTTTTDGAGAFRRRIFAGMMMSIAFEEVDGPVTTRRLETFMDLMPGDALPIDVTPPLPSTPSDVTTDLIVRIPSWPAGATEIFVQSVCGQNTRVYDLQTEARLGFTSECAVVGHAVPVLATAIARAPNAIPPTGEVLAYAFSPSVPLTSLETRVDLAAWVPASAPGSTLTTSTLSILNDGDALVTGVLLSQNLRGARPDAFDIAQLTGGDGALGLSLYLVPGASHEAELPFIREVGPWRRVLAIYDGLPGGGDNGVFAFSYEVEQGVGTPPASFGTRRVTEDLLPTVSPNYLTPQGPDPERPTFGWYAPASLGRADIGAIELRGEHECSGYCASNFVVCSSDAQCPAGDVCTNQTCDELRWRIAWQPWPTVSQVQLPVTPTHVSAPVASWLPSGQRRFEPRTFAWIDLDFIDGWRQAVALGRGVFPFGGDGFLSGIVPEETTFWLSFIGDN